MSPQLLLELVKNNKIPPQDLLSAISTLSTGLIRKGCVYDANARIYRAQKMASYPENITRMSYPPLDTVKLGRANQIGEQIFYASGGLPTTINESRVEEGSNIYVGEWMTKDKMTLQIIGFDDSKDTCVERLFHEIFTSPTESYYLYSATIAKHLLNGGAIDGLLYPSIISKNFSHNLALKKCYVDNSLQLINVRYYKVVSIKANFQYNLQEIDFATPLNNGSLDWKNRPAKYIIAENGGSLTLTANGWGYTAKNRHGQLVDPI